MKLRQRSQKGILIVEPHILRQGRNGLVSENGFKKTYTGTNFDDYLLEGIRLAY